MRDIESVARRLKAYDGPEIRIMEVCGTHTASIFRHGIRSLLSPKIRLISGPGCPVCVTEGVYIDAAAALAMRPENRVYSFGDMFKVAGKSGSLSDARARGANAELIYAPLELLERAEREADKKHIVCAVGFETTAPVYALCIREAERRGIKNLFFLTALKSTLPAIEYICENERTIDAFLCPGHVSVICGAGAYEALCERYKKPFVVGGFEAEEILAAIYEISAQLKRGEAEVKNFYGRAVSREGNLKAKEAMAEVFEPGDASWRGLGLLKNSALNIRKKYEKYDAAERFSGLIGEMLSENEAGAAALAPGCRCADVICGRIEPPECPLFKSGRCTPESALGPCMVSTEGACGIWYSAVGLPSFGGENGHVYA